MYNKLPSMLYPVKTGPNKVSVYPIKDIGVNIRIDENSLDILANFDFDNLRENDQPENVAWFIYENPKDHYLVMLSNDRWDWRAFSPVSDNILDMYVREKYGQSGYDNIHHFVDDNGNVVDDPRIGDDGATSEHKAYPYLVYPITNREYEREQNESLRSFKYIKPEFKQIVDKIIDSKITNG